MSDDTELDQLRHSLEIIDAIRAGTWKPDGEASASRLAILDAACPPGGKTTGRPQLRVIQGGKTD